MAQVAVKDKCDLCKSEADVDFFCVNCDEILCPGCKVSHANSKATRNHKIMPLLQARDENIVHKSTVVYCSKHSTVELTLFCMYCDQLICTQCFIKEHNGHNIAELDQIRDSRTDKLKALIKRLQEKKTVYEDVFQAEGQSHSQFLQSIDQAENDISVQKAKIIKELDAVCEEQFSMLSKLRQDEEKRYSDVCNKFQAQSIIMALTLQTAQNSIASNNTALIMKVTVDTIGIWNSLENPSRPTTTIATFKSGNRSRLTICGIQGKVNIKHTTATQQTELRSYSTIPQAVTGSGAKCKPMNDVHTVQLQEEKTKIDNRQENRYNVNKPSSDVQKYKVKSTITLRDKGSIQVIVPLQNKTAWIKAYGDSELSLIDRKGQVITKSVKLNDIYEVKEYENGLLVTWWDQYKITKLSAGGKSASTFSNLSPYIIRGLCVTRDMQVMVCLHSTKDNDNNKVVRLNSKGDIIQTIQYNVTGAPLYNDPLSVTSLTTGEVIVVDHSEPNRIIGVDSQGQHLFTWEGEVEGRKLDKYSVSKITNDSNNNIFVTDLLNNRVYVLGREGSAAMHFLDSTHGIYGPQSIAVDDKGQLCVGCYDGKIHIILY